MERKEYLQQFEHNVYEPETDQWIRQVFEDYQKNRTHMEQTLYRAFVEFMTNIGKMQKIQPIKVGQIAISFLRTGLWNGEAKLRLDAYDVNKEAGINLAYQYVELDWLQPSFDAYREKLAEGVQKENLERFIRIAQIEQYMSRALTRLITLMMTAPKYALIDFDKMEGFELMQKEEVFMVTAGEYLDRQKVLFATVPEIDIVARPEERATFQRISKKIYRNKEWKDTEWRNARFEECEFSKCSFTNMDLRDTRFVNCLFRMDRWEALTLHGAAFVNCTFRDMELHDVGHEWKPFEGKDTETEFFREVTFRNCILQDELMTEKGEELWNIIS